MLMGLIWTAMIVVSVLFGCLNGTVGQVQQAALEGAHAAIELCIAIGGAVCLWCAVMELMRASGLAEALSHALRPILRRLFPESARHEAVLQPLSANVSANLLGLGNAATPMGIRAAEGATSPFDILPAVWISSAVSVAVGLAAACAMERRP